MRMRTETGTEFFEWTDHIVVSRDHGAALRAVGLVPVETDWPPGHTVLAHPHAMLPRVLPGMRRSWERTHAL